MLEKFAEEYLKNIRVCILFALLLVFVPFFTIIFYGAGITLSSGTVLADYNFSIHSPFILLFSLVFLALYSFFVSLVIFAVRRNLSTVRVEFYLEKMVKKFALKIFIFYSVFSVLAYIASSFFSMLGIHFLVGSAVVLLAISIALFFVPQAIVIDEVSLRSAVMESISFVKKFPKETIMLIVLASAILFLFTLIEFVFDLFFLQFFAGSFASLFLVTVFLVPFIEIAKTYFYMLKFNLIRKSELVK